MELFSWTITAVASVENCTLSGPYGTLLRRIPRPCPLVSVPYCALLPRPRRLRSRSMISVTTSLSSTCCVSRNVSVLLYSVYLGT